MHSSKRPSSTGALLIPTAPGQVRLHHNLHILTPDSELEIEAVYNRLVCQCDLSKEEGLVDEAGIEGEQQTDS